MLKWVFVIARIQDEALLWVVFEIQELPIVLVDDLLVLDGFAL